MRLAVFSLFGLVLSAALQAQSDDDQKRIQGKWKVSQAEKNGENVPIDQVQFARFIFERDKLITNDGGKRTEKTFKLNATATPRTIDIIFPSPVAKGKTETWPGIYRFTKDGMWICFSNGGKTRPSDFRTRANSNQVLMFLERDQ